MTYISAVPPALVWLFTGVVALLVLVGVLSAALAVTRGHRGRATVLAMTTVAIAMAWVFVAGPTVYVPTDTRRADAIADAYGVRLDATQLAALRYPDTAPGSPRTYGTARASVDGAPRVIELAYDGHALHLVDAATGVAIPKTDAP
jgi:hypothetical protein